MNLHQNHIQDPVELLMKMIRIPSFSREEGGTADLIEDWFGQLGITTSRKHYNIWASNKHFDPSKPTILLNSHHDTVRPNENYTRDPFDPVIEDGKLFGLGSNDAGGALVSLMSVFAHFYPMPDLPCNFIMAATAEEEISGENGIRSILADLPEISFAVVGEPTDMQLAISEKGLLVIDAIASGEAGHAAYDSGDNAIYKALKDIQWISGYSFPLISPTLGETRMTVTQINAGTQHNVIPAECRFVIDVRFNEMYTNRRVFEIIDNHTESTMKARSFKHSSSSIPRDHPFVQSGVAVGRKTYGSATMSDQTALSCPSVKIGPGHSPRSHSADEFILPAEIREGIMIYRKIFEHFLDIQKTKRHEALG